MNPNLIRATFIAGAVSVVATALAVLRLWREPGFNSARGVAIPAALAVWAFSAGRSARRNRPGEGQVLRPLDRTSGGIEQRYFSMLLGAVIALVIVLIGRKPNRRHSVRASER